jgi:hypothetical protein
VERCIVDLCEWVQVAYEPLKIVAGGFSVGNALDPILGCPSHHAHAWPSASESADVHAIRECDTAEHVDVLEGAGLAGEVRPEIIPNLRRRTFAAADDEIRLGVAVRVLHGEPHAAVSYVPGHEEVRDRLAEEVRVATDEELVGEDVNTRAAAGTAAESVGRCQTKNWRNASSRGTAIMATGTMKSTPAI